MATTSTEAPVPITPSAQVPEAVVAEEVKPQEEEDIKHSAEFVAEVASIINHEDIQAILATQEEMYVDDNTCIMSQHNITYLLNNVVNKSSRSPMKVSPHSMSSLQLHTII